MKDTLKIFLSLCLVLSGLAFGVQAEASTIEEGYVTFEKINESTLKLIIENGDSYIDEEGTAFITDSITGQTAELPKETLDKNEMPVNLVYKKQDDNLLVEYHSAGFQTFGFWQCTLGTVGAAGTGTLAGMGIGAIAATPVTVLGGGVFGGIAGGMTGASASCFN
ncbi:hypothetical protein H1Q58_08160 [Planococcus maritimus]|uniref:Pathogenicity island protein n=1 Tax=Planococcus maritimus TaxID=192421 RepID=A0A7D7RC15_PLAMR|nr:hypothetical protein [Planococcus maritimus]QMT18918.1 hypothetical protein H1Q58_08160 [Planococcus maritimus]